MPRTAKRPAKAKAKSGRYVSKLVPRRRGKLTEAEREATRQRMRELREQMLAGGDVIRTYDELMREIADRRGGVG